MKHYVCYSLNMARYLTIKGHHMSGTAINTNAPWRKVYYFTVTDKLLTDAEKYIAKYSRDKKKNTVENQK